MTCEGTRPSPFLSVHMHFAPPLREVLPWREAMTEPSTYSRPFESICSRTDHVCVRTGCGRCTVLGFARSQHRAIVGTGPTVCRHDGQGEWENGTCARMVHSDDPFDSSPWGALCVGGRTSALAPVGVHWLFTLDPSCCSFRRGSCSRSLARPL